MRTSYSALETFRQCPLKFKCQNIDRILAPKSNEAIFGSHIHTTLKFIHAPQILSPTLDEVLDFYQKNWPTGFSLGKEEENALFNQGTYLIRKYYEKNHPAGFQVIQLETYFEIPLEDPLTKEKHILAGKIDRIDKLEGDAGQGFEIIDYKTSKTMPAQSQVENNFQLSLYNLAFLKRWPNFSDSPIKLSLYFLKHGEKLSAYQTKEQLQKTQEYIINTLREIEKSDFKPTPSPLCDWCGYQKICPLFRHKYMTPAPNEKEIKQVIKEYFEIKSKEDINRKRLAELKNLINKYCDENQIERVFGEEGSITRLAQIRYKYDNALLKIILEPLGKWNDILTVNSSALRKVIASLPSDIQEKVKEAKIIDKEFKVITTTKAKK